MQFNFHFKPYHFSPFLFILIYCLILPIICLPWCCRCYCRSVNCLLYPASRFLFGSHYRDPKMETWKWNKLSSTHHHVILKQTFFSCGTNYILRNSKSFVTVCNDMRASKGQNLFAECWIKHFTECHFSKWLVLHIE